MIHSYNMKNEDKPYRTEMSNGKNGYLPIHADSGLQTDAEDMTPSEILEAALASCTNMTVRGVLNKRGIPYDEILVDVRMQTVDGKTTITRSVKVVSDADPEAVSAAVERARNCHLYKVLTGEIVIDEE